MVYYNKLTTTEQQMLSTNYRIQYPDDAKAATDEIAAQIADMPFSLCQLQYLRNTIEQRLEEERKEYQLFMVGDRAREHLQQQFVVLCQALEMNSIGVMRMLPVRDSGDSGLLRWTITHRSSLASAMLVLRASDDVWEIRAIEPTQRASSAMAPKQREAKAALDRTSLTQILESQGVSLAGLQGWKLAS